MTTTEVLSWAGVFPLARRRFLWFHEHVLERDEAEYGVRLSFALSDWVGLARRYPPALSDILGVRERDSAQLLAHPGPAGYRPGCPDLLSDVAAMDQYLHEDGYTFVLFEALAAKYPESAGSYWARIKKDALRARRFDLIRRYGLDFEKEYASELRIYGEETAFLNSGRTKPWADAERKADRDYFLKQCRLLMDAADAVGQPQEAEAIRERARKAAPPGPAGEENGVGP